jgi:hypothetical protein
MSDLAFCAGWRSCASAEGGYVARMLPTRAASVHGMINKPAEPCRHQ